jgi:trans-aconitate methyltransferase
VSTDFGSGSSIWPSYYAAFSGRSPRPLFAAALERFGTSPQVGRRAVDLGSGDGTETEALLREGWVVLAVDAEPDAIARLEERIPAELRQNLRVQVRPFEEVKSLPRADFIYSGVSLPFCRPDAFPRLWSVITSSVVQEGRIACDLFGERDTWADRSDMTFFTRAVAERLLDGFAIEQFDEMDEDGEAFSGPKHWHIFSVIARRSR